MGHPLFARLNGGVKVTLFESASGRWTAQTGYGYATGATKDEALAAVKQVVKDAKKAEAEQIAAQTEAANARSAKRAGKECELPYCNRAIDTPAHRLTAGHRNAVAVADARVRGEYRG